MAIPARSRKARTETSTPGNQSEKRPASVQPAASLPARPPTTRHTACLLLSSAAFIHLAKVSSRRDHSRKKATFPQEGHILSTGVTTVSALPRNLAKILYTQPCLHTLHLPRYFLLQLHGQPRDKGKGSKMRRLVKKKDN
jgi:hypothetical protein